MISMFMSPPNDRFIKFHMTILFASRILAKKHFWVADRYVFIWGMHVSTNIVKISDSKAAVRAQHYAQLLGMTTLLLDEAMTVGVLLETSGHVINSNTLDFGNDWQASSITCRMARKRLLKLQRGPLRCSVESELIQSAWYLANE